MPRLFARTLLLAVALSGGFSATAAAQTVVKYGAEFLAAGVGARALGMGGAFVAHANDVTAGYWNVAGLQSLAMPEAAYMHAERFGGAVSFDYAAAAYPLSARSTVGVSFVRSAVDDIANTLDAIDPATGLPRPDAADRVTLFSAADNALFVSYARAVGSNLQVGATAKVVRRGIGDFASAWGYSLDVGAQMQLGRVRLGATLQDATGMVQAWSVDEARFAALAVDQRPVGLTEIVLPVARLGAATTLSFSEDLALTTAFDVDLGFDGQQANVFDAAGVSFRPRIGGELGLRETFFLRAGIADVATSERFGTQITPAVGAGVRLGTVSVDYGFGDFGGVASDLGVAHRVSLGVQLGGERYARPSR